MKKMEGQEFVKRKFNVPAALVEVLSDRSNGHFESEKTRSALHARAQ